MALTCFSKCSSCRDLCWSTQGVSNRLRLCSAQVEAHSKSNNPWMSCSVSGCPEEPKELSARHSSRPHSCLSLRWVTLRHVGNWGTTDSKVASKPCYNWMKLGKNFLSFMIHDTWLCGRIEQNRIEYLYCHCTSIHPFSIPSCPMLLINATCYKR